MAELDELEEQKKVFNDSNLKHNQSVILEADDEKESWLQNISVARCRPISQTKITRFLADLSADDISFKYVSLKELC